MKSVILFLCVAITTQVLAESAAAYSIDLGPIYARMETVTGEKRVTAAGPFFETVEGPRGEYYWGLRPLYAHVRDPERNRTRNYFLWPIASTASYLNEFKYRCLIVYGRIGLPGYKDSPAYRFTIFPFYWQSRGHDGRSAVALFPIGGRIQNFIWYKTIDFALFPLWVRWQSQDVVSQNFLWPFFSRTTSREDDDISRRRFFPFYMRSYKEGYYNKKSVMWPIWNYARYMSEGSKGYAWILFPLYGQMNREGQKGFWLAPPFFRFQWGTGGRRIFCPWPFVQYDNTKYMKKFYLWPLFGTRTVGPLCNRFFLWPLIWDRTIDFKDKKVRVFQFVPFVVWDRMYKKNEDGSLGEITMRRSKIWPLFSYRRDGDVRQTRVLELWPFREDLGVAQTWAPLWTLFSHTVVNDVGYDTEVLWGLYRNQRRGKERRTNQLFPLYDYERDENLKGGTKKWSFLKGLIGYKREHGIRRYRLLYFITFGGKRAEE
jgi:hypothetical protein